MHKIYNPMKSFLIAAFAFAVLLVHTGCTNEAGDSSNSNASAGTMAEYDVNFERLPASETGIQFANTIEESYEGNYYVYDGFYQGAGVGIGDLNNDGLADIYMAGNQVADKLYFNKGDFRFQDVTRQAGIAADRGWSTAVTIGDFNGDSWNDIYVCKFLWQDESLRHNKLYINNQDGTFSEKGAEFGVDDTGFSMGATILDYDKDGDNDLYVVNQPPNHQQERKRFARVRDYQYSGQLYQNNNNEGFVNVTADAGLRTFGFGLGVVASDLNNDGWTDLYLAFDYDEPDLMMINNQNGTFSNIANESLAHMSNFGMGVDAGDINNDGWMDVFVADMVAPGHERIKTQMSGMNPERFFALADGGYHYQYMFNSLQVNNGNGRFSEIGQLAGVGNTDWSWTVFFADFNLDGYQDLYVTNGIKRDMRDNDYQRRRDKYIEELKAQGSTSADPLVLLDMAPSTKIGNFMFENQGDFTFKDKASDWGLEHEGWSYSAAYGDLDNDGDLDLVVNNVDEPISVYRNNSAGDRNAIIVRPVDASGSALNAVVRATTADGMTQTREVTPSRGYMTSCDPVAHFGLAGNNRISELVITWPDGMETRMENVKANQTLVVNRDEVEATRPTPQPASLTYLTEQSAEIYTHQENAHDDYIDEILLPHKMSTLGPCMAVADVNNDNLDDVFIGGATGQPGVLAIQQADGSFSPVSNAPWNAHRGQEDIGAVFFDADGDGDHDLYVASGSNEQPEGNAYYRDRLYLNDGKGSFSDQSRALPPINMSTSAPTPGDFDQDGDIDLFVAGRQTPNQWPYPTSSYLLVNDGNGGFTNADIAAFNNLGMVTDANWVNLDADPQLELVLVGEWMPVTVFDMDGADWVNKSEDFGFGESRGWWNSVTVADLDGDGDQDIIGGNLGLNIKYKASADEPFKVYSADFDENGSNDIYLGYYEHGHVYPVRGRTCSSQQMPFIKEKFPTFKEFALADVDNILGEAVEGALVLSAQTFETSVFINNGNGFFEREKLDNWAQFSTVQDVLVRDFNDDGHPDLLLAGNYWDREVETRRSDASVGLLMLNDGKGSFNTVHPTESGFNAWMDARVIEVIRTPNGEAVVVANNNGPAQVFSIATDPQVLGD